MIDFMFSLGIRTRLMLMGWIASVVIATPPILLFSNNKVLALGLTILWSVPVLGMFYWISKEHISKPVETLARELELIGKGDFSRKIDISLNVLGRQVHDEFYTLNESVNKMQKGLSAIVNQIERLSDISHQMISVTMPLFFNLSMITEGIEGIKLPEDISNDAKKEISKVIDEIKKCIKDIENLSKKTEALMSLSNELKTAMSAFKV